MEVGLSIAQLQRGMDVEGFYLLKAAFAKVTTSGKPFLSAVLADTSGTIEAKVWDYSGPIGERDVGKVLKVRGSVSDYRGMPQLTVDKLRLGEDNDCVDVSRPAMTRSRRSFRPLRTQTTVPCARKCCAATRQRSAPFPPPRACTTAFCPAF